MCIFSYQCRFPNTSRAQDHKLIFAHAGVSRHTPLQPANSEHNHISINTISVVWYSNLTCVYWLYTSNKQRSIMMHLFTFKVIIFIKSFILTTLTLQNKNENRLNLRKYSKFECIQWNVDMVEEEVKQEGLIVSVVAADTLNQQVSDFYFNSYLLSFFFCLSVSMSTELPKQATSLDRTRDWGSFFYSDSFGLTNQQTFF